MARDLFTTLSMPQPAAARGRLLPFSVALHVLALGVVVIAPLFAVDSLPPPRAPLAYHVTQVVLPRVPADAVRSERAATAPHASLSPAAQPAPTSAPSSILDGDFEVAPVGPIGVTGDGIRGLPGFPGHGTTQAPVALPRAEPRPVQVGGRIRAPRKIHDAPPVYPAIARQARVQGIVILEAVIGPDGRVRGLRVLRSVPLLDQAAIDAVRQWVFTPTELNGEPVPVAMTVTVQFRLDR